MSERIHALAQHLLGKSSIEECSLEEIQHLTKRYPFFAPAQFLLLQKLKASGSPDAAAQQRKAVLYYHDPLQFDYVVSSASYLTDDTLFEEQEFSAVQESLAATMPPEIATAEIESADNAKAFAEKPSSLITPELPSPASAEVFPEPDIVQEERIEPATEPAVLPVEPLPEEPVAATEAAASKGEPPVVQLPPLFAAEQITSDPAATELTAKTSQEATQPLAPAPTETASASKGGDVLFEPFHTVDYFASQGIKVTAEDLGSKDKLSKQMRSFTEWLKIMKRLPAAEMARTPQTSAEKSVENMASHSVEESEVVTEAMAEVWVKQGARAKAIETYNKLSLLNPSKKAYFAAKIENLKGS